MTHFKAVVPVAMLLAALLAAPAAQASAELAAKAGCATCHAADKPLLGPSWQAIAGKYKGQANAASLLAERVRKGSVNVWGKLPMPPTPTDKMSDADLKLVVSWVLKTR